MSWAAITSNDVDAVMSSEEKTKATSLFTGTTTITDIIALVVARVRGYVGRCSTLDVDTTTIPDEVRLSALILIRHHVITRLPGGEALLTDARVMEYSNAEDHLRRVARCEIDIEAPDAAACAAPTTDTSTGVVSGNHYGGCAPMRICPT